MSYLRIDGDERKLVGGRIVWQPAESGNRRGVVFQLTAHGGRTVLHLAGWAPGDSVAALGGQNVALGASGPDAALDGRFLASAAVRFGRVRDDRCVVSIDGVVEPMEAGASDATLEADIVCTVRPAAERRHCLGCGRALAGLERERDDYVGGFRVRRRVPPTLCADCTAVREPRHCPSCGEALEPGDIEQLGDEDGIGFTATCPQGHTFSGTLDAPATT